MSTVYQPAVAQDPQPGQTEESEPAGPDSPPLDDDQVIVRLPPNVEDPTNTQVGPSITAAELEREQHFHTAEVEVGAQPVGQASSDAELAADRRANARTDDYWIEGGPDAVPPGATAFDQQATFLAGSYNAIYVQAHPDDEVEMLGYIDEYGNNSAYHKVFAVLTRGEQSNYCNYDSGSLNPNEIPPNPAPTAPWVSSCDSARINSFVNFMSAAANLYDYIDSSYSYYGEVSLASTTPVDPCVRNSTADGDESGSAIGVDALLDSQRTETRFTCTSTAEADDVRIYRGASGYTTILFFNLGDGDLTRNEVEWAMRRLVDSGATLQVPSLQRRYVVAPFANVTNTSCTAYTQPDHRVVHEGVSSYNISTIEQLGSTCDTDVDADRVQSVPVATWNGWFRSPSPTTAFSYHDRHYGWLIAGLWSSPYTTGKCGVGNNYASGEENCLNSRLQNYWSEF